MEELNGQRYYRRAKHPLAGRSFFIKRGNYRGQCFTLVDWAVNVIRVPTEMLNVNGADMLFGTINAVPRMLYPDQIDTPIFIVQHEQCVIPDPEC